MTIDLSEPPRKNGKKTKYKMRTREEVMKILDSMNKDLDADSTIFTESKLQPKYGITKRTYANWKHKTYKEDCEVLEKMERIDTICEARLIQGGLLNEVNATFAKFILTSRYGYVETQKTEVDAKVEHSGSSEIKFVVEGDCKELPNV